MTQRGRGRPRAYDRDTALRRALEVFWRHGFAGTSLDRLSAATAMNRPSLYAAFGDKRSMYLAALDAFGAELGRRADESLSGGSLAEDLTRFYSGMLDLFGAGTDTALGCLAICTAATEAPNDTQTRDRLRQILDRTDQALADRFATARAAGQFPSGADPHSTGRIAAGILHTLAVRVRAGQSRQSLDDLVAAAVAALVPGPG